MQQKTPQVQAQPVRVGTNGFAIASFVTSLFGIVILGLVFGFIALDQLKHSNQEGRGFAIAGIAISFAYLGLAILGMLLMMLFFGVFVTPLLAL